MEASLFYRKNVVPLRREPRKLKKYIFVPYLVESMDMEPVDMEGWLYVIYFLLIFILSDCVCVCVCVCFK